MFGILLSFCLSLTYQEPSSVDEALDWLASSNHSQRDTANGYLSERLDGTNVRDLMLARLEAAAYSEDSVRQLAYRLLMKPCGQYCGASRLHAANQAGAVNLASKESFSGTRLLAAKAARYTSAGLFSTVEESLKAMLMDLDLAVLEAALDSVGELAERGLKTTGVTQKIRSFSQVPSAQLRLRIQYQDGTYGGVSKTLWEFGIRSNAIVALWELQAIDEPAFDRRQSRISKRILSDSDDYIGLVSLAYATIETITSGVEADELPGDGAVNSAWALSVLNPLLSNSIPVEGFPEEAIKAIKTLVLLVQLDPDGPVKAQAISSLIDATVNSPSQEVRVLAQTLVDYFNA